MPGSGGGNESALVDKTRPPVKVHLNQDASNRIRKIVMAVPRMIDAVLALPPRTTLQTRELRLKPAVIQKLNPPRIRQRQKV